MNLPKMHKIMSWIVFVTLFCILSVGGIEPAGAFQPQPEIPGVFLPTLTMQTSLRVNIAYLAKESRKAARCIILYRSLLDGDVIMKKELSLGPGEGMSLDVGYRDLFPMLKTDDSQLDANNDIPLRIQVKADKRKKIFIGFEIHDAHLTDTLTYIPGGAEPLD